MLQNPKHLDVIRCIDATNQHASLEVGRTYHVDQSIPKEYEGGGITGKVTLLERGGMKFEWRRFEAVEAAGESFGNDESSRRLAAIKGATARAMGFPVDVEHGYAGDNAKSWKVGWQWCNDSLAQGERGSLDTSSDVAIEMWKRKAGEYQSDAKHCEQIAAEACKILCQFRPAESQQLIQRIKRAANGLLAEPEVLKPKNPAFPCGSFVECLRHYEFTESLKAGVSALVKGLVYRVSTNSVNGSHINLHGFGSNAFPVEWFKLAENPNNATADLPPQVTELNA